MSTSRANYLNALQKMGRKRKTIRKGGAGKSIKKTILNRHLGNVYHEESPKGKVTCNPPSRPTLLEPKIANLQKGGGSHWCKIGE